MIKAIFFGLLLILMTSCASRPFNITPDETIKLDVDEGIIVFRMLFGGDTKAINFKGVNGHQNFLINYDKKDWVPRAYIVEAGTYCLASYKYVYTWDSIMKATMDDDNKYCFTVYPGKASIAPEVRELYSRMHWKDNSRDIAYYAAKKMPQLIPYLKDILNIK